MTTDVETTCAPTSDEHRPSRRSYDITCTRYRGHGPGAHKGLSGVHGGGACETRQRSGKEEIMAGDGDLRDS